MAFIYCSCVPVMTSGQMFNKIVMLFRIAQVFWCSFRTLENDFISNISQLTASEASLRYDMINLYLIGHKHAFRKEFFHYTCYLDM